MLIDTHAHLNFNAFKDDADKIIQQCLAADIWMINVGSQLETSRRAVEMAKNYSEGVYAAIGLHPIHTLPTPVDVQEVSPVFRSKPEKFDAEKYKKLAQSNKVVAIGEIGLDWTYAKSKKELQEQAFRTQLSLAQELNLPVIIHCRKAWKETIGILKKFYSSKSKVKGLESLNGVAHFFSGSLEDAQELFKLGFFVSFTGVITFSNAYNGVIKKIPLGKMMVETDCPYVAPFPHRGKRNQPLYVKYVAQKIAGIKETRFDRVARVTTENARKLFRI